MLHAVISASNDNGDAAYGDGVHGDGVHGDDAHSGDVYGGDAHSGDACGDIVMHTVGWCSWR